MAEIVEWFRTLALLIWSYDGVKVIVLGVLLNVVLAVAVALRNGTFSLQVLGEFLSEQLLPYVLVYFTFKLFGQSIGFEWVSTAAWALITAMIGSSIVEKLGELGVPIPDSVLRAVKRPQRIVELRRIDDPIR